MPDTQDDNIEALKNRLYSRDERLLRKRREGTLHSIPQTTPLAWSEKKEIPKESFLVKNTSTFKKFFIISVALFVISLGFVFYKFYEGGNAVSNENIDINILGNAFTAGGEELPLQIEIVNKNSLALEYADLVLEYPKGSETTSQSADTVRIRKTVGTISSGKIVNQTLKFTLFGEQGSVKNIKARLEYRVGGSNAIFIKERDYAVTINSSPLALSVDAPLSVTSSQDFSFNVKAVFQASKVAPHMLVKIEYPPGFQFKSAEPKPNFGNNIWELGDLAKGAEKTISIKGSLLGQDGEDRSFHVYSGEADPEDDSLIAFVYNSLLHTTRITKPFLEASLVVGGQAGPDVFARSKSPIQAEINWSNNLPIRIENAQIVAHISGGALDKNSISPFGGFFDSKNMQIIWDKNTNPELASIDPGERGKLTFSLNSLSLLNPDRSIISNPQIAIQIDIKGTQPSEGGAVSEVENSQTTNIKILSDLQLVSRALYSGTTPVNTGSIPPQAEKETTYTIVWTVTNSSNQISDAEVSSTLPVYVRYIGTSLSSQNITYNEATRQITWKVGSIPSGAGFGTPVREASFQVGLTPSTSQIGTIPVLVSGTTLVGTDVFAGASLKTTNPQVTTKILNDVNYKAGDERVVK